MPSKRLVGVELEYDGNYHDLRSGPPWNVNVVEDGSLGSEGFEVVSSPASGDRFVEQIEYITRLVDAKITKACGMHVHIDASDYGWHDLRRLIILYERIECYLMLCVPRSRRDNTYCAPCAAEMLRFIERPGNEKHKILGIVAGAPENDRDAKARVSSLRRNKYHSARYSALNLCCWFRQGTIECRLAAGTNDPVKIIAWARLWSLLVDFAAVTPECKIKSLPRGRDCIEAIDAASAAWLESRRIELCAD